MAEEGLPVSPIIDWKIGAAVATDGIILWFRFAIDREGRHTETPNLYLDVEHAQRVCEDLQEQLEFLARARPPRSTQ